MSRSSKEDLLNAEILWRYETELYFARLILMEICCDRNYIQFMPPAVYNKTSRALSQTNGAVLGLQNRLFRLSNADGGELRRHGEEIESIVKKVREDLHALSEAMSKAETREKPP